MKIINDLMVLYDKIDEDIARFQKETGLQCPFGCGLCCPTADIYATVLEMLPAAAEIFRQGKEDYWLTRISEAPPSPGCVLYLSDRPDQCPGHCAFYPWRATVCRLFGFAAVRTRDGGQILAACKHLKAHDPEAVGAATAHSDNAPCFSNINSLLYAIDPTLGNRLMPINEALREAIHRIGLFLRMSEANPPNDL